MNNSRTSSRTSLGRAPGRSILLITTIGLTPASNAFLRTKRVCGIVPSYASTKSKAPSTICMIRSTSPPKSACPGVSKILIVVSPYLTAVFLDKIVIPRSRSISFESIARSSKAMCSGRVSDCFNNWLTKVVLPWSTCAMIAIFLISSLLFSDKSIPPPLLNKKTVTMSQFRRHVQEHANRSVSYLYIYAH